MGDLSVNPALAALQFNAKVSGYLEGKAKNLLEKMNQNSALYNDVNALASEFKIRTNFDQDGVSFIDFEGSEFQELIDHLHDKGILEGERHYKFENKKEINTFQAKLETKSMELRNKNQEYPLLIEPLIKLLDQMNKIAKSCSDSHNDLLRHINSK